MRIVNYLIVSSVVLGMSSCSYGEEKSTSLTRACESFTQYKNSFDIPTRVHLLAETSFQFREEAYSSNEVKYEVLAEYASMETDRLGNISQYALSEINDFCKNFD